jgi:hypothetical protein
MLFKSDDIRKLIPLILRILLKDAVKMDSVVKFSAAASGCMKPVRAWGGQASGPSKGAIPLSIS